MYTNLKMVGICAGIVASSMTPPTTGNVRYLRVERAGLLDINALELYNQSKPSKHFYYRTYMERECLFEVIDGEPLQEAYLQ
jgi:Glu-tRNA(Gln) amidotransferase subunit E-like FAD-binding protein